VTNIADTAAAKLLFCGGQTFLRSKFGDQFIDAVIALTNLRRGPPAGRFCSFVINSWSRRE
jgi:hypothetical protein